MLDKYLKYYLKENDYLGNLFFIKLILKSFLYIINLYEELLMEYKNNVFENVVFEITDNEYKDCTFKNVDFSNCDF